MRGFISTMSNVEIGESYLSPLLTVSFRSRTARFTFSLSGLKSPHGFR